MMTDHLLCSTTVSALHRPQVLPSAPASWPARNGDAELQEISRRKVRQAASEITRLAEELIDLDLVKYLPTTGYVGANHCSFFFTFTDRTIVLPSCSRQ